MNRIDLHIHSKDCSDGRFYISDIIKEAHQRKIEILSVTDHDSIDCQKTAMNLSEQYGIKYLTGVELNISFSHTDYNDNKPVSLDVLGYNYDVNNNALKKKLGELRAYRKYRAEKILDKINVELKKASMALFTNDDLSAIEETVDGAFGRPHIADYMVKKGTVSNRQEAFDRYLVKCDVPKMSLSLEEASALIRDAGGKLILAHGNCPRGTSLAYFTTSIEEQLSIIKNEMLPYLDGLECWHSSHDRKTTSEYLAFASHNDLLVTGGSDCHQQPVILGSVYVPYYVAEQFGL